MKLKIINNANSERIILELTAQTDREKLLENKLRELIAEYNRAESSSEDLLLCSETVDTKNSEEQQAAAKAFGDTAKALEDTAKAFIDTAEAASGEAALPKSGDAANIDYIAAEAGFDRVAETASIRVTRTDENNTSPNKTEANVTRLIGYRSGEIRPIFISDISCFTIEDTKLIAHTRSGKYKLKERLWEIEGLVGEDFIKINQSCLVCIRNVLKFDTSIGGSLKIVLDTGYEDYVSRRQMKTVKTRILGNIK